MSKKIKYQYDNSTLKKLKEEFKCNLSDIAKWLGVSRQSISGRANKGKTKTSLPYWQNKEWTEEEIRILNQMITQYEYFYQDEQIIIQIYQHISESQFVIFIKNNIEIKCFFDIPAALYERLIKEQYHKYNDIDQKIRYGIRNSDMITTNMQGIEELRFRATDYPDLNRLITNRILRSSFKNRKEYFQFLGFHYLEGKVLTDKAIKKQLKEFLIKGTNQIYIPSNNPRNFHFRSMANRKGFSSLKSFVEYFGYKYKRINLTNIKETAIQEINKYYLIEENKVYLSAHHALYTKLYIYAKRRGKTLTDLLKEWGYVRIYKEDLPPQYVSPQKNEIKQRIISTEDDVRIILDELVIEDNLIYINSSDPIYTELIRWAIYNEMSVNEMLEHWGYQRIYLSVDKHLSNPSMPFNSKSEELLRATLFEKIKKIQGSLTISKSEIHKRERSQKLSLEMKKMYGYRCQLCSEENPIPLIEKEDGTFYVEVHHIVPISERELVQDDAFGQIIDTYKNVIVVCSHHHKVLHYHSGGFQELIKGEAGLLYFRSKKGDLLKVETNYHLKPSIC
ncbi:MULTISPECIES: HNH endonuclease [Priestia]|uniref:HNH endonuclease n=1 Tax=Priestia TaxID=2800373 RepID=UPI001127E59B|nr:MULTISPECIES: HNH endonuclease [Priestia]